MIRRVYTCAMMGIFITLSLSIAVTAQAAEQSIAEKRARDLVKVLSTGDRGEVQKFVEANFNDQMRRVAMERHFGFFLSVYDSSRGFDINGIQELLPNSATLLVKNKLTGEWDAVYVSVEDKEPFKINGVGLRPPKPPETKAKNLTNKEIAREMEVLLKKLVDADVFSGSVLLAKDGQIVFKGAYGIANKDFNAPNKIDTKFNLGSMNKMFTGVAIAQLIEKGKMSFDDPLSKFISDFPNAAAAQKIKIKHLLTHTSGLGGYFSERYDTLSRERLRTVDEMMNLVRQDEKEISFEPGSRWRYSNTGMLVLGKVIEIVSGQSYYDYVRENIYKPAGMINTDCYELDKVNTNLAVGYDKQFTDSGIRWGNNVFRHVMRGGPHGGGYSTAEDLLKFDQALRSGKLVSAETLKVLTSPKPELNSPEYGYGFGVDTAAGTAGHSGGFPGISSNLDMYLGSGWTAIVMSNYSRAGQPVIQKMLKLVESSNSGSQNAAIKK